MRGCGADPDGVWALESAKSGFLANLVRSLYRNGKDLGHPRRKTRLSPVALSFAELEPASSLQSLSMCRGSLRYEAI